LKIENPEAVLREYGLEIQDGKVLCPFHNDEHPSCGVDLEKQVFFCHACRAKGTLIKLLAGVGGVSQRAIITALGIQEGGYISQALVEEWHRKLLESGKALKHLREVRGLTADSIRKYKLGLDNKRITIPVYDSASNVVNVRKRHLTAKKNKTINVAGHGKNQLYLLERCSGSEIIIAEGELKALLLRQKGFQSVSPTGGAGSWDNNWNEKFRDKNVSVIFDIDKAGVVGAVKTAKELHKVTDKIRIVRLPLDHEKFPTGGIDEYFLQDNGSSEKLRKLISATELWKPQAELQLEDDETIYLVKLAEASKACYFNKFVRTSVVVSAKDVAPYIVPTKFAVRCTRDKEQLCSVCPCFEGEEPVELSSTDPVLLELIDIRSNWQDSVLRKAAKIPKTCNSCQFQVLETTNIEDLRLIPQVRIAESEDDHVARRGFFIGHGLETNAPYTIEARVVPDPRTQYATLLIYKAEPAMDSLSTFALKPKQCEKLKLFQPREWTMTALDEKLEELYADLETNVTRIYRRRDLHLFIDLVYHSVLYIPFQGRRIKGWSEGLIIGDPGQGKSDTAQFLQNHYQLGERIDSKGASVAGLIGGLQETQRRWFVTWGIVTLNDKRLVVLEEAKGMSTDVISKLTEARSSGIAEVSKIEKARTNCRTRLIWISNPRSDRSMLSYNYGVEAVIELVGTPEDVRRFDMAIGVATGEVPDEVLNMREEDRPKVSHVYTSDLCRDLVLWAWSRGQEQVMFEKEALNVILATASEQGRSFAAKIPLVEPADHRYKLARLSAGLAARTFSTDDGETLIVRRCHAESIAAFLHRVYSGVALSYDQYSSLLQAETKLVDPNEVEKAVRGMPYARDTVRSLLETRGLTVFDIADWTGWDKDRCRDLIGTLVRKNALRRERRWYGKTPMFIELLKRVQMDETLTNVASEVEAEEEF